MASRQPPGRNRHPSAIPALLAARAAREGAAVVLCDYWLARRQRIHIGWLPVSNDQYQARALSDVLAWLHELGIHRAYLLNGHRTSPRPRFAVTLHLEAMDFGAT